MVSEKPGLAALKALSLLILRDIFKATKVKLFNENSLLESTSLPIKSKLKIDANPGLAYSCLNNRAQAHTNFLTDSPSHVCIMFCKNAHCLLLIMRMLGHHMHPAAFLAVGH